MMSSSVAILSKLQKRAVEADQIIDQLKIQLQTVRQAAVAKACLAEQQRLSVENAELRCEVERLKSELISAEVKNGVKQILLPISKVQAGSDVKNPSAGSTSSTQKAPSLEEPKTKSVVESVVPVKGKNTSKAPKAEKKTGDSKPAVRANEPAQSASDDKVDVSRLNMRIGRIVAVKKHPDADSLYVEEVDVGESKHRTIVSGLVKHVPIEQMQDRVAVFLLNLKPAKMRGVTSEGMIMCASSPEKVEIIVPPTGAAIGDRVTVEGYPGPSDEQLNPKKKTWEQIQPDLRINSEGVATYKGARWFLENKEGLFKAPSMIDSAIK